jgi:hypothetical protein
VVFEAVFGLMHADLATGRRCVTGTLTILRQMRSMLRLPPPMYAELNATLMVYADGRAAAIAEWLEQFAVCLSGLSSLSAQAHARMPFDHEVNACS